jgi:hypothetical protein
MRTLVVGNLRLSTILLLTIGLFDLVASLMMFRMGYTEGNPLFRYLLEQSQASFVFGKIVFLAAPIAMLEYAHQIKPKTGEIGTWVAFWLYATIYVAHMIRLA